MSQKQKKMNKLKDTYRYYARIKADSKIIVHKLLTFAKSIYQRFLKLQYSSEVNGQRTCKTFKRFSRSEHKKN